MAIIRYHVRDSAGQMHFNRTEAQKEAIVAQGGSVLNTMRYPGEEKTPVISKPVVEEKYVPKKSLPGYTPRPEDAPIRQREYGEPGEAPITEVLGVTGLPGYTASPKPSVENVPPDEEHVPPPKVVQQIPERDTSHESDLKHRRMEAAWTSAQPTVTPEVLEPEPIVSKMVEPKVVKTESKLPDPSEFVGIPGPGSGPRPGSVGDKIQTAIMGGLEEMETAVVGLKAGMSGAGKEMGAEAQEALGEGDILEAALKGTVAFTARAGAGVVEGASFIFRPLAWGKTAKALYEAGKGAVEHPEDIPSGITTWAEQVIKDPGSIVEFAGDIAGGFAVMDVVKTIAGPSHVLTRVDDIDIDVKASTLELVDEVSPISGKTVKYPQFPEAEITPTVSRKTISKAAAEIVESELDEFTGAGKILGVADEGGVSIMEKIDVPEGALDDLLEGKKVTVKGPLKTETLDLSSEAITYVDEITDPITGKSMRVTRETKALPLDAKEMGKTIEVMEDASKLDELVLTKGEKFLDDTITVKLPKDVVEGPVTFKGPWFEEGAEGVLEKGQRRYEVKGVVMEGTPDIIDDIPEFKPVEPGTGPKTPLSKTFGVSDEGIQRIDDPIVIQTTEKTVSLSKVITEPATVPSSVTVGLGLGASLATDLIGDTKSVTKPIKVKKTDAGLLTGTPVIPTLDEGLHPRDPEPTLIGPIGRGKTEPDLMFPLFDPPIVDTKPKVDPMPGFTPRPEPTKVIPTIIPDIIPVKPRPPKPVPLVIPDLTPPGPKLVPPIVDPYQIPDEIQDVIPDIIPDIVDDTIITPIQIVDQKQKPVRPPPVYHLLGSRRPVQPPRIRKPRREKRRRRVLSPLGFETKKYKMPKPEDFTKMKRRKMRLPKL